MAGKNNGSGNGNGIPWWAEKMLWRLEAQGERHDTLIKLIREEIKKHNDEIAALLAKSNRRDEILTDHSKAIRALLGDLKRRSK